MPPRAFALPVALFALAGCFSTPPLHTARPLPNGQTQLALAGSVYGWEDPEDGEDLRWGNLELQARFGLGAGVDGGVKTNLFSSLGIDVNWALVLNEDTALSVNPTVELPYYESSIFWLPVLWDCHRTETAAITLGAFGGYFQSYVDDDDGDELFADMFLAGAVGGSARLFGGSITAMLGPEDEGRFVPDFRMVMVDESGEQPFPVFMLSFGYLF